MSKRAGIGTEMVWIQGSELLVGTCGQDGLGWRYLTQMGLSCVWTRDGVQVDQKFELWPGLTVLLSMSGPVKRTHIKWSGFQDSWHRLEITAVGDFDAGTWLLQKSQWGLNWLCYFWKQKELDLNKTWFQLITSLCDPGQVASPIRLETHWFSPSEMGTITLTLLSD